MFPYRENLLTSSSSANSVHVVDRLVHRTQPHTHPYLAVQADKAFPTPFLVAVSSHLFYFRSLQLFLPSLYVAILLFVF